MKISPSIKKQIEDYIVGWGSLHTIQVATQFFEEIKTTVLSHKWSPYKNRNEALETIQNPPILSTNLPPIHVKRLADIVKIWTSGAKILLGGTWMLSLCHLDKPYQIRVLPGLQQPR